MTISKEVLDELLKGCERPEDLLGDAGLMKELKIKLMERMAFDAAHENPVVEWSERQLSAPSSDFQGSMAMLGCALALAIPECQCN